MLHNLSLPATTFHERLLLTHFSTYAAEIGYNVMHIKTDFLHAGILAVQDEVLCKILEIAIIHIRHLLFWNPEVGS